jgi:hypothetical protein
MGQSAAESVRNNTQHCNLQKNDAAQFLFALNSGAQIMMPPVPEK